MVIQEFMSIFLTNIIMAKNKILDKVNSPADVKKLSFDELDILSLEVADFIKEVVKVNGGHYSSPLGVVDLTIALHYCYNAPEDKIIWDVGHQAYSHKILTGRKDVFNTIRQKDGISGFLKQSESEYDAYGAGHASTSISAGLGFAHARDIKLDKNHIVSIIGDGAMTGGLAYEAINNLGFHKTKMTIILNDNSKSISDSVGALSKYLSKIISHPSYNSVRSGVWDFLGKIPVFKNKARMILKKSEESLKSFLTPGGLFEELGVRYIGPIDGHDIENMVNIFENIKKIDSPILLHVLTKKGHRSVDAESDSIKFYSLSGTKGSNKKNQISYSNAFGMTVLHAAKNNKDFVCITAAMEIGTGLKDFSNKYPERIIDVGIAENHAVTYGSGFSSEGIIPVIAIYSTFIQRAYDNILHDFLLQDLPFILCLDRSGVVGADGPTHHGLFDINMFLSMPNIVISAPKDGNELRELFLCALELKKPFVIRYPKGNAINFDNNLPKVNKINVGTWEILKKGNKWAILAVGSMVEIIMNNYELIEQELGFSPHVINARFVKPLDKEMLNSIANDFNGILTIEEGMKTGGFGSYVLNYLNDLDFEGKVKILGIEDKFIDQGTRSELLDECGLTADNIIATIKNG